MNKKGKRIYLIILLSIFLYSWISFGISYLNILIKADEANFEIAILKSLKSYYFFNIVAVA